MPRLAAPAVLAAMLAATPVLAQQQAAPPSPTQAQPASPLAAPEEVQPAAGLKLPALPGGKGVTTGMQAFSGSGPALLQVPVVSLAPGNSLKRPDIRNPDTSDAAAQRGMQYFTGFNCIGCHADNGGGGMGPSLSNWRYIYGEQPANIFLTIKQGRPNGMPAWGSALPDEVIWDLVSYVLKLRSPPPKGFGHTISRTPPSPDIEQVPTEYVSGTAPWKHTQSFSAGQKPNAH
ncbi:c-type cytochrome [Alsobacter sp. SYSU M60028]|uniref:C-type cytochrome n=1 Tax=Alsobacter ponti TaxID=2962936 RepID=A0ABT1L7P7_9HYPH|nr:c-type cytochrome [Alsobacter ponti]MCP8937447.1 c-type cytochrome [Alsobacter ponti]